MLEMPVRPPDHEVGCFKCDRSEYDTQHCHAMISDSWGYGQPCGLDLYHTGLHKYQTGAGFVIMWGYE